MQINFIDLKQQYERHKDEINQALSSVLESTAFIMGPDIAKLEQSLSLFTDSKYAMACSSGTDALLLSLMALDIKPGDEIITTPFSFMATAEVICLLGATPVFVDIDPETYNIDASLIEAKISKNTKAIIPVSLYGQCADMDEINDIAERYKLTVIEDACQSFGAEYKGRKSGNLSTIGCTSFFPSKPLGCYGDGGAIFTNDDELGPKIRMLLGHGQVERYRHRYIGINGRIDTIQAAVLNVKMKYFPDEILERHAIGKRYSELFQQANQEQIITPMIKDDRTSVYAQYSIRVKDRDAFIKHIQSLGIPTAVHYPIPMYRQEALSYLQINPNEYPVTEVVSREIVSLPMSPYLTREQQDYIVESIVNR
ncbi:DegT/DnrJ/EryC1/StrS family aminotransferase [Paenibacillus sedimenti]|uniref:DegT/DnrJ/EryC1/StrS family aminotransferase n=1 Tax=Paenibacillus sedimenti TaxID=2770274 RepID=A0A926QLZ9_9BACL|nr:DegT/DnrJ/EryC1/StrS family aminotransferase [Paenibacillus sedimenti]MBD0384175.1 DegT/DnrJ/EryC1/StrS family aminotransferase [Paenibacillus sedimenti]